MLRELLQELPLIAILRGIRPEEMPAAADALMAAGFRILEVPLNSPRPLESIRYLAGREGLLSGAGTVLTTSGCRGRGRGGRPAGGGTQCRCRGHRRRQASWPDGAARRGDADGGLCRAQGRRRWAEDVSRRADAAQGDQGLARRAAGRDAAAAGGRDHPGEPWPITSPPAPTASAWARPSTSRAWQPPSWASAPAPSWRPIGRCGRGSRRNYSLPSPRRKPGSRGERQSAERVAPRIPAFAGMTKGGRRFALPVP